MEYIPEKKKKNSSLLIFPFMSRMEFILNDAINKVKITE